MRGSLRALAGGFAGVGALILLWQGETAAGVAILASMLGFFIGDANGRKERKAPGAATHD